MPVSPTQKKLLKARRIKKERSKRRIAVEQSLRGYFDSLDPLTKAIKKLQQKKLAKKHYDA
jgi:hypothetical protein